MANKIVRFNKPPEPNILDPLAQLKWVFFVAEANRGNASIKSIQHAKGVYLKFIHETNAGYIELEKNPRFYLNKHWEVDALIRFTNWLKTQDYSSKSRYSIYKQVRLVMNLAYGLRIIDKNIYHSTFFEGTRETKIRAAYNSIEQETINSSLAKWISLAISVLQGYKPTGLGLPIRKPRANLSQIKIEGMNINEAAKEFGVPRSRILRNLRLGWTERESVGLDKRKDPRARSIVIDGNSFDSIAEAAQAFSVPVNKFRNFLTSGMSPEQAAGLEDDSIRKNNLEDEIEVQGIKFLSIREAAKHFKLVPNLVLTRLNCGWPIKEAFTLIPRANPLGEKIVIEGIEYSSLNQAGKIYNLGSNTISRRLKLGATPEQAVGITPINIGRKDERALIWIFENTYECNPLAMMEDFRTKNLFSAHQLNQPKLLQFFSKIGVWPYVDASLIMPLAVELAMLTGLNVEAIKNLKLNSYTMSHPLTGQPSISYNKPRSGSTIHSDDQELHLPFLEIEELMLDESIAVRIENVINIAIDLTARIRHEAPNELANHLFIFKDVEKSNLENRTIIVPIDPHKKSHSWLNKFAKEEGFKQVFGPKFSFNIARCRPTLATNMILNGADLLQVQSVLGHKNVITTAGYLDGLQIQPFFNKTISEAIRDISMRTIDFQKNVISATNEKAQSVPFENEIGFYETLSGCGCKNAFNPSANVREATNYREGSVCKYWNMCLLCDNSIITQNSLPKLINYRDRVSIAITTDSPAIRSRAKLYEDTVVLIDGIVEPGNIFPHDVIDKARIIAATENSTLLDQLIYQGI